MRTPRLGVGLFLLGATLVVLTTWALTASATRVLRHIAQEQTLSATLRETARVLETAAREAEAVAASARILSERPTLHRLLETGTPAQDAAFLETFRRGGDLASAAVFVDGALLAAAGDSLPAGIAELVTARVRTVQRIDPTGQLRLVAFADVEGHPGALVAVARVLDPSAGAPAGSTVQLRSREAVESAAFGARTPLREEALAEGRSVASRLGEDGAFVAVAPLRSADEIVGVVEAESPASRAADAERAWVAEVRRIALFVLVIALLGSIVLARTLATPLERLGRAAVRIGLGDLETPVPEGPGGEVGALARTMEDMRVSLRETSAQLRRSRAESESILAGMHEGVFDVDTDRRVRYVNPHLARVLGVTAAAAAGRFCGDVLQSLDPDGRRPCEDACPILAARAGGAARAVEHVVTAAGRRAVIVTSAAPVEGRQVQLLREETDAEAGRRLRDAVLANVTHEFRTPLAAQIASIEMLRDRLDTLHPDEIRGLVLALQRGSVRLARLVDNLLESARLEAGEDSIRHRPVALDEVLEEAIESMRPLAEQRRQRIELDLAAPLPPVSGDAPRLVQVFVNLLANANKFAPEGTTIRVGARSDGGDITAWVSDEGPGLPEGDDSIFERFGRRAEGEPEQSGLGLGLWIARSIVERHGGRLHADPGEGGARLTVVLPRGTA